MKTTNTPLPQESARCLPAPALIALALLLSASRSFAGDLVEIDKLWPENRRTYTQPSPCESRGFEIRGPGFIKLTLDVNPDIEDLYQYGHKGSLVYWNVVGETASPFDRRLRHIFVQDGKLLAHSEDAVQGRPLHEEVYYAMDADRIYKGVIFLAPPYKTDLAGDFEYQWTQAAHLTLTYLPPGTDIDSLPISKPANGPAHPTGANAPAAGGSENRPSTGQVGGRAVTSGPGVSSASVNSAPAGSTLAKGSIVNLALRKPARQSSVYAGTGVDQGPQFGVDGIRESLPRDPYLLVHTNADNPPWWQVDLLNVYPLTELKLYNRIACCGEKARTIQVLLSDDGASWETVYRHDGSDFKILTVDLQGKTARYVRLQLAERTFLHFQECEVYGYQTPVR